MAWSQKDISVMWGIGNGMWVNVAHLEPMDFGTINTLGNGVTTAVLQKRIAKYFESDVAFLKTIEETCGALPIDVAAKISEETGTGSLFVTFSASARKNAKLAKIEADYRATKGNDKTRATVNTLFAPMGTEQLPEDVITDIVTYARNRVAYHASFDASYKAWQSKHEESKNAIVTLQSLGLDVPPALVEAYNVPEPKRVGTCLCGHASKRAK